MITLVVTLGLLMLLMLASLGRLEAWPFSSYQMFSRRLAGENVLVFRLELEDKSGVLEWWTPEFFYFQRDFGYEFGAAQREMNAELRVVAELEILATAWQRIQLDHPARAQDVEALRVVERCCVPGAVPISVEDTVVRRVAVRELTSSDV